MVEQKESQIWRTNLWVLRREETSLVAQTVKESSCSMEDLGLILGSGRSPGEGMATHSSILAWRIPMDIGAWWPTVHGVTENPLDRKSHSILQEINPEYSLEGLMLKLKLQYFDHLMQRMSSLEKILMLGKTEGRGTRGQQRMSWLDGIID